MPREGKQTGRAHAGTAPDPRDVLTALHGAAPTCRKRIPNVTNEVETLAKALGMLPAVEDDLALTSQAIRGLLQAKEAIGAYLLTLGEVVSALPLVMEPDQARWLDEYRTLHRLWPLLDKFGETQFVKRGSLAAALPDALKQRKDLAVVQTMVFWNVQPVLDKAGIPIGIGPKAIACRATAALVNLFTDYKTTPEAVSKEVRRQSERRAKTVASLKRKGTNNAA
jgi:hypothetical protein